MTTSNAALWTIEMPTARTLVKGTKYYAAPSRLQTGNLKVGQAVKLIPEPTNEADPNAVAIWTKHKPQKLGHISKELAPRYGQMLAAGSIQSVHIHAIDTSNTAAPRITIAVGYDKSGEQANLAASRTAEVPATSGVYAIVNAKKNRWYIGSSIDMRSRARTHFNDLENRSHHNPLLQRDYIAQDGVGFRAIVIVAGSPLELAGLEKSEIRAQLADGRLLYNLSEDGQGSFRGQTFAGAVEQRTVSTRELASLSRRPSAAEGSDQLWPGRPAQLSTVSERMRKWQPFPLVIGAIGLFLIWIGF